MNVPCFLLYISLISVYSAPISNYTSEGPEDITKCMKEFYIAAYKGEDYDCVKKLDVFSKNTIIDFKEAKSCLLEIAKEECFRTQYNYLNTKYDEFLEVMAENSTNCSSLSHEYAAQKCEPLTSAIIEKMAIQPTRNLKINDPALLELIAACDRTKECLEEHCFYDNQHKMTFKQLCEVVELSNTEFTMCQLKLHKEAPDLSGYSCLHGFNFYLGTSVSLIDKYTLHKDCTKEIMEDYCGKEAVKDFDRNAGVYVKNMRRFQVYDEHMWEKEF